MARDLGIDKCWFHTGDKPHYDIPKKRIAAIARQCIILTPREIMTIIQNELRKSDPDSPGNCGTDHRTSGRKDKQQAGVPTSH